MRSVPSVVFVIACGMSAGCGGSAKTSRTPPPATGPAIPENHAQTPTANPTLTPLLAPLGWWIGDWKTAAGTEHWTAVSGVLLGVALTPGSFEVLIVDDSEGPAPGDGALRFVAMPEGNRAVEFALANLGERTASFANPQHDAPKQIAYTRTGNQLVAQLTGGMDFEVKFDAIPHAAAPELEAADREFAAATAARGVDGWVEMFDVDGHMLKNGSRVVRAAIGDMMGPLLARGQLAWTPVASGRLDKIGYTVGNATFTGQKLEDSFRSVYVTIWKAQRDGTWKVLFDTGRVVNEAAAPSQSTQSARR